MSERCTTCGHEPEPDHYNFPKKRCVQINPHPRHDWYKPFTLESGQYFECDGKRNLEARLANALINMKPRP